MALDIGQRIDAIFKGIGVKNGIEIIKMNPPIAAPYIHSD